MIPGAQLAQVRPGTTAAATAFTALMRTEVKKIVVCNTSGGNADYSIFHDDDGTTFNQTTALFYTKTLATKSTDVINAEDFASGVSIATGGAIGVQSSVADALTFTLYGATQVGR